MENKNILDIGSIISDINRGTASKIGKVFQDKIENQDDEEKHGPMNPAYEDKGPIGDYEATYLEICHLLENTKQKWGIANQEYNIFNTYYQRDLFYLYDRITLDMQYLNGAPDRNNEWLEKLLELKYEIRNML